ncbi:transglycosylase SLT domain-containing protein [Nonomuraea sp. LPB2021202275-12-8]|uniref:aggregation-promoting factor C-terminal-like domain-containing protein n=1 Tax=Nonomuraea sp. LPB2021202275-12-8 TaxID=3120159 RepID=UPI00300CED68
MPMLRRTNVLLLSATLMAAGGATAAQAQSSQTGATSAGSTTTAASKAVKRAGKNKALARTMVAKRGWAASQFSCLARLWAKESGWNHRAGNRSSGAYGIPQALPGHKMATKGRDWRTNPRTQIAWGLSYIKQRYGTPCRAWGHFQSHNWY